MLRRGLVGAVGMAAALSLVGLGSPAGSSTAAAAPAATVTGSATTASTAGATYQATVYRTRAGIPHIVADDYGSLGYGTGYAMAQDNLCLLADLFLTYAAERSRFLRPDNGNLESDEFYQLFIDRGEAWEKVDPRQAAVFRGAAAGYNRYLRDTGVDNLPDPSCRGADWVRPLGAVDWRRVSRINFFLPALSRLLTAATPPTAPAGRSAASGGRPPKLSEASRARLREAIREALEPVRERGSNGIAVGRRATKHRTGMLLTNPHLDWQGYWRFYAFHQILRGKFNILGANPMGRPQVGFGTSRHVAWTSTVTTSPLHSFYLLRLDPNDPTRYLFDGTSRPMRRETVAVTVPGPNGPEVRRHTFYTTHFGAYLLGGPNFPWTGATAFAVRPVNPGWRGVDTLVDQYQARSVRELKRVHDQEQFLPGNLIAADDSGRALYADPGPRPNLTDAQLDACDIGGGVLDGSRTGCMWNNDPDTVEPGILPPDELPWLIRKDYVANMNDSYWLTNPRHPLPAKNRLLGSVATERTLRTRGGLDQIEDRLAGRDGQRGHRFTLRQLQQLLFGNESYTGEILRDDMVRLCRANPHVDLRGQQVDISEACDVLADWDLRADVRSRGAHLFREIMVAGGGGRYLPSTWNYRVPFDPEHPVQTPRRLDRQDNPQVLQAIATAVTKLRDADVPLDARLGDVQYVVRNGDRIPIHGGTNGEGLLNIINAPFSADAGGYPTVTSGSSWIQFTELTRRGPRTRGILTYSLSNNPESPRYDNQTRLFSREKTLRLPFTERAVRHAAHSRLVLRGR